MQNQAACQAMIDAHLSPWDRRDPRGTLRSRVIDAPPETPLEPPLSP